MEEKRIWHGNIHAIALGMMAKGVPKHYTPEEIAKRTHRLLTLAAPKRWAKKHEANQSQSHRSEGSEPRTQGVLVQVEGVTSIPGHNQASLPPKAKDLGVRIKRVRNGVGRSQGKGSEPKVPS